MLFAFISQKLWVTEGRGAHRLEHPPQHGSRVGFGALAPSLPRPGDANSRAGSSAGAEHRCNCSQRLRAAAGAAEHRPRPPRDTALGRRAAGCPARHGRRTSTGRQAAEQRCVSGHRAGLGGFPNLGRDSIVPLQRQGGGGPGPGAAGHPGLRVPWPSHVAAAGARGPAGSLQALDTTPGTKSRPTDRSGHRRESRLRPSSPQTPLRSLRWQSIVSPRLRTAAAAVPGCPFQAQGRKGLPQALPPPWEAQPDLARAPLKWSQRHPGWCPWAGAEPSPSPSSPRRGAGGTRSLCSKASQAPGQTSARTLQRLFLQQN